MKHLVAVFAVALALLPSPGLAGTTVLAMYGMGDNAFGSSQGIDVIAAKAARMRSVSHVQVFNYWQTQDVANAAMRATGPIVLVGYSCGGNSASTIAAGLNGHKYVIIATIQPSLWCGGYPLDANVPYAQETYGGCLLTLGFGCKIYDTSGNFRGHFVKIKRPDLHPFADLDPDAQADVLSVIAAAGNPKLRNALKARLYIGRTTELVRYRGERP